MRTASWLPSATAAMLLLVGGACGEDPGFAGAGALRWSVTEELRLGTVDGGAPDAFGDFIAIEASEDSTLFVADQQSHEIRVFGAGGQHLHTFGRRGAGPGEFQDLIGLALDPQSRLWAVDFGEKRFSIFDSEHRLVETRPFRGFRSLPWAGRIDRDGALHDFVVYLRPSGPQYAYIRSDTAGADTLPLPPSRVEQREAGSFGGRQRLLNVPYGVRPYWTMDEEGLLWFGSNDSYKISRINYRGDTVATIQGSTERIPLSREEHDRAIEQMRKVAGEGVHIDPSWVPKDHPFFDALTTDDEGRLWVRVPRGQGVQGFDVFDKSGNMVAQLDLPQGIHATSRPLIRGRHLYIIARDEVEVPYVIRYHIE